MATSAHSIWGEETFPPADLEASRTDRRLQRRMRREVGEAKRAEPHLACPECGTAD